MLPRYSLLLIAFAIAGVGRAAPESVPLQLPAVSVMPEFVLRVPPSPSGENKLTFLSADKGRAHLGFALFRSATLQDNDQVVSVNGKQVADLQPFEGRRMFYFTEPGTRFELEVRQPGAKATRKAVAVRMTARQAPQP